MIIQVFAPEFHSLPILRTEGIWHVDMRDIDRLLKKHQIKQARIVKAQVCLETGFLSSEILRVNKNLFGMRYAKGRKTTAISERYGCAVYANIEESIKDYRIWQDLYYKKGDYYQFLQHIGYAEDRNYIKKLKKLNIN